MIGRMLCAGIFLTSACQDSNTSLEPIPTKDSPQSIFSGLNLAEAEFLGVSDTANIAARCAKLLGKSCEPDLVRSAAEDIRQSCNSDNFSGLIDSVREDIMAAAGENHFLPPDPTEAFLAAHKLDQALSEGVIEARTRLFENGEADSCMGIITNYLWANTVVVSRQLSTSKLQNLLDSSRANTHLDAPELQYPIAYTVQHADEDFEFQHSMLDKLQQLGPEHSLYQLFFDNLTDRILERETGRQRFGTIVTCTEHGTSEFGAPLEGDAENLGNLRERYGLTSKLKWSADNCDWLYP